MGTDKALLPWQGRALWKVQLEKLQKLGARRCLVACREEQRLHEEDCSAEVEWLFDPPDDEDGPLGVISRALQTTHLPLVALAVDMPFMTVSFLRTRLEPSPESGCFFTTSQGTEPMTACYAPAMLPVIERRLAHGERSLQKLISECAALGLARVERLGDEDTQLFTNANTPGEWQDCQRPNMA
jgi:molybdopterin-guanine dinucleotide biosynthesis protein A